MAKLKPFKQYRGHEVKHNIHDNRPAPQMVRVEDSWGSFRILRRAGFVWDTFREGRGVPVRPGPHIKRKFGGILGGKSLQMHFLFELNKSVECCVKFVDRR